MTDAPGAGPHRARGPERAHRLHHHLAAAMARLGDLNAEHRAMEAAHRQQAARGPQEPRGAPPGPTGG